MSGNYVALIPAYKPSFRLLRYQDYWNNLSG